jgi:Phage integrase family
MFGLHVLRHSAAAPLIAAGGSAKAVQTILGHGSAAFTLTVYGHLFDADLDELGAPGLDGGASVAGPGRGHGHASCVQCGGIYTLTCTVRSSGGGTRTHNLRINSPPLCQLSYPGRVGHRCYRTCTRVRVYQAAP